MPKRLRDIRTLPASVGTLLALVLFLLTPAGIAAQAQNEVPPEGEGPQVRHPEAAEAIDQLWSPYCPGLMLEVCPSAGGAALRDSLQQLAEEGRSSQELVDWVLANHGEEYRALPEREGAALLAWLGPPLAVVLGIGVVLVVLVRMRARRAETVPGAPESREPSEDEERRLREAMKELDEEEEVAFF